MQRWYPACFAACLAALLLAACSGAAAAPGSTPAPGSAATPAATAVSGTSATQFAGQQASSGTCTEAKGVRLCVDAVRYYDSLPGAAPRTGNRYLGVRVTVANKSADLTYAFPANMSLVDAKDKAYTFQFSGALLDESLAPEALLQGERAAGMIVFEVPQNLTAARLRAKMWPKGPPLDVDLAALVAKI